jgi:hypothetical protein
MKRAGRFVFWGVSASVVLLMYVLDWVDVFPNWLLGGPVAVGVAGTALVIDRVVFSGRLWGGYWLPFLLIGLSAGTVLQDAEILGDEYAVWPAVVGALGIALLFRVFTGPGGSPRHA